MPSAPDSEMEILEAALRDLTPEPDPAFARDLDRRLEEGFPRPKRWRPPLFPALATAVVLIALAVVGVTVLRGDSSEVSTEALQSSGQDHELSATAASPARRVERSIRLALATPHGKLADVAAKVGEVTSAHGGYVLRSSVSTGDDGTHSGDFTLRIPAPQLEPALADLSDLGDVRERNETSQDLTAPFSHVQERLANALLERRETADRLRRATGDEAVRLRARLREINAEIRALTVQLRSLRRRTALSTVSVRLQEKPAADNGGITGGGPRAALDDALAVVSGAFNLAIRAFPFAALALIAWFGVAMTRRRRREAALF